MSGAAASMQGMLYVQLADSIVAKDPQRSAHLVRISLNSGINPLSIKVCSEIRLKDPLLADDLFRQALSVAQKDTDMSTEVISWMVPYLFPNYEAVMTVSTVDPETRDGSIMASQTDPVLIAQFLRFAYAVIMKQLNTATATTSDNSPARAATASDYMTVQKLLPVFERYLPERAANLRALLARIALIMNTDGGEDWISKISNPSSIQDILASAETAQNSPQKDGLYSTAAMRAAQHGDYEVALSIIKRINNEQTRSALDSTIRYRGALAALGRGEIDLACGYGKDISDLQKYAVVFSQIAKTLYDKKNIARAVEVINDAELRIVKGEKGQTRRADCLRCCRLWRASTRSEDLRS